MTQNKLNDKERDLVPYDETGKKKLPNPLPAVIAVLAVCVIALIYYMMPRSEPVPDEGPVISAEPEVVVVDEKKTKISEEEVEAVLEQASDLITSRYFYTNAADFDSVLTWFGSDIENPFTHSKGYIVYDGVVSVGVDLEEITFDIDNDNQVIVIHLPDEKVLAHEIDNNSVVSDTKESIFNSLDAEYYAKLIGGLKKNTEKKVFENEEYMKQVRTNTELVIKGFLTSSEVTGTYTVKFAE